jgi:hypothetical protein
VFFFVSKMEYTVNLEEGRKEGMKEGWKGREE